MQSKKILVIISTTLFSSVLLSACGGSEQTESKVTKSDAAVAKVSEKMPEKKAPKEQAPKEQAIDKVTKGPTVDMVAKKAAMKVREKETVRMTLDSAKNSISNAAQAGFEWTVWKKMIAKAEVAFKGGDMEKAATISYKILHQSNAALKQATVAEKAGPRF
ncbi:MAG TPA: hypothetical protein EYG68_02065 [Leucothrix mucor]|nr:hypothetical protein [Leucothrix mucor]